MKAGLPKEVSYGGLGSLQGTICENMPNKAVFAAENANSAPKSSQAMKGLESLAPGQKAHAKMRDISNGIVPISKLHAASQLASFKREWLVKSSCKLEARIWWHSPFSPCFYDDFPAVVPDPLTYAATHLIQSLFTLLGFQVSGKPSKNPPFAVASHDPFQESSRWQTLKCMNG